MAVYRQFYINVFTVIFFLFMKPVLLQVFVDQLTSKDMEFIGDSIFSSIDMKIIVKMVEFSNRVSLSSQTKNCVLYIT